MSMEGIAKAKNKVRGRVSKLDVLLVSAYDIAVKHGYTGTEEEFYSDLDSFDEKAESTAKNALVALERSVDAENAAELAVQSAAAASRSENNANEACAATTHMANSVSEWMLRAEEAKKEADQSAQAAKASAENAYDSALTAGACLLNTESYMQKAQSAAGQAEEAAQRAENAGAIQSDWDQNDSAAADYVKNRPFYTVSPGLEDVSVPMEAVSTPSGTMYISPRFTEIARYHGFYLVKDCDYLVTYDDMEYNCKAFEYTTALEEKSVAIGNPELVAMGPSGTVIPDGAGTDAPFAILGGTEFRSFDGETNYVTIAPVVVKLPNEYLDEDYIKDVAGGGGNVEAVQPDWNQNDSTAADYVKNRPFYTEGTVGGVVLTERTVTVSPAMDAGLYVCNFNPSGVILSPGETYIATYDGADYVCVCEDRETSYGAYIGNLAMFSPSYQDTGEPFWLLVTNAGVSASLCTNVSGTHTIGVRLPGGKVKTLDEKYIPDTIARVDDIPVDVVKTVNGVAPDENGNVQMDVAVNYDLNVKAVNHRGYSTEAPENTIPAYILSKKKGFTYVECDVSFTKDGVAVLLHDSTIDRTSDGSGSISDLNFIDVYQYDFGSWKSADYAGTKIPTFKEFIILCRNLGLHPYIELKSSGSYTREQICSLVDIVEECGMKGKITWISFSATFLSYIRDYDKTARLGYVCSLSSSVINTAKNLRTGENDVFLDCSYSTVTDVTECVNAGIPVEVWTVNSTAAVKNLNPYVSGVTSDSLIAGKILHDASMNYVAPEPDLSAISISLSTGSLSFENEQPQTITATLLPVGCTDPVVWTSSDESVARVENGVVTPVGAGSAVIKATVGSLSAECTVEVASIRTLLYNWDFTNSMTDTVSGFTPTLLNNATQDANGLHITQANAYANFGAIGKRGMTFELDITADSVLNTGTAHGRLLCFSKNNNSLDDGVLWRGQSYNYWGTYLSNGWGAGQLSTDQNVFSGKTMITSINEDGTVTVYAGNELLVKTDDVVDFETGGHVTVGSSSIASIGVTITSMRIYEGSTYIPQTKPNDWVDDVIVLTPDDLVAKGIAFGSDTGANYPYLMSRTDRISFTGYNVTLDPEYEYSVAVESSTGAIGKLAVRQVPSWYDVKAKVHLSASHDSGWKDSGYVFSQESGYECAWFTFAAANTTDNISLADLTSVIITRSKSGDIPAPLVNISMTDGKNIGSGGSKYNATLRNGGAFANGQFTTVDGAGSMDVPVDFVTEATSKVTAFVVVDTWAFSDAAYQRFFCGAGDEPAVYLNRSIDKCLQHKLLNSVMSKSNADYYDSSYWTVPNSGGMYRELAEGEKFVFAIRCDGEKWSFWTDGVIRTTQLCSNGTASPDWSLFRVGDGSTQGYSLGMLKCSKFQMWNSALTDAEMYALFE